MKQYGLQNPFRLSAQATRQLGASYTDLTVYGETPWITLERMLKAVDFKPGEHFVELGAGTGRNLLWVAYYMQSPATGFELVPDFVSRFQELLTSSRLPESFQPMQLQQQNWFEADFDALAGDVFLLVGTCYDDLHRQKASACLRRLKPGQRVITVSYALPAQDFILLSSFTAPFSWGKGTVYVHERGALAEALAHDA